MKEKPKPNMDKFVLSPMPGTLVSINVKEGDMVAEGKEVCIVEAMKMQNLLSSTRVGKVKKVYKKVGESVGAEEIILEFE